MSKDGMLVLCRREAETIMVGDDVEIYVVQIRPGSVRIGVRAPEHIPVHRREVYEAIKRGSVAAADTAVER